MNFLKEGGTNWKYILMVVILAVIVGGGILGYCYWWLPKEVGEVPEVKPSKGAPSEEIAFLQNGEIWILYDDLKTKMKVTDSGGTIERFSFSSDGKKIFYLKKGEIWSINRDGTGEVVLTDSDGEINFFSLSPDGEFIAYQQKEADVTHCANGIVSMYWTYVMKKDGTAKVKIESPYEKDYFPYFGQWFPDSKKILIFAKHPCEGYAEFWPPKDYYGIGLDGKNPQKFTALGVDERCFDTESNFSFLPNSSIAAYTPCGRPNELWLVNYDGTERRKIFESGKETFLEILQFSLDGEQIIIGQMEREYGYIRKILSLNRQGSIVFEIIPEKLAKRNPIEVILSPDEKYIIVTHKPFGYKVIGQYHERDEIWIYNISTKEIKEFVPTISGIPPEKEYLHVKGLVFSGNNRLFYQVTCGIIIEGISETFPQLWAIDTNTWENHKIIDNVLQVVRLR